MSRRCVVQAEDLETRLGGRWRQVSEKEPLVIPAHQVAVVKTYEFVNLPRFLIAKLKPRWDVHSRGDEDWLGYASESLSSVLGERSGTAA